MALLLIFPHAQHPYSPKDKFETQWPSVFAKQPKDWLATALTLAHIITTARAQRNISHGNRQQRRKPDAKRTTFNLSPYLTL